MSELLEKIKSAVLDAAEILERPFTVEEKNGASNLVTSADVALEAYLRDRLAEILPEADFLGEEGHTADGSGLFFVVDPIDGTANFTRRMNMSAVSVGLVRDGEAVLGVIYDPYRKELFYAEQGKGAYLNGTPIHVSDRDISHSVIFTAFSLYRREYAPACLRILERVYEKCDDFRRLGSAVLELSYLCCGRGELYFEARVYPWDVCAALCILKEAGGYYASPHFDRIDFTRPFSIVCANSQSSLDFLLSVVREEMPALNCDYLLEK